MSDNRLQTLNRAIDCLSRGDIAGAESSANVALIASGRSDGTALQVMGLVRMRQGQWEEATSLLGEANLAKPRQPLLLLQLGQSLSMARRPAAAVAVLSEAVALKPDFAEAWYELGNQQQHQLAQLHEAEDSYRHALALQPRHGPAKFGLAGVLNDLKRFAEAETVLVQGCSEAHSLDLVEAMLDRLLVAQQQQNKREAALATIERLQTLNPARADLDGYKADLLQDLSRFDEALAVIKTMLGREPSGIRLHEQYNHILYQLNREDELLSSYDWVPQTTDIRMSRALFALTLRRAEQAEKLYSEVLAHEPENIDALVSVAAALDIKGHHTAAMELSEKVLRRFPEDPRVHSQIASTALQQNDPEKAAAMLEKVLTVLPHDDVSLARLGTAWRMMDDPRDEALMGYEELVRIFDLEPPSGYSSMASFNQELDNYLGTLHPPTREFLGQSVRGGTQTRRHLFNAGHELIDRIKVRIDEAVGDYIAELKQDPNHPLRARRRGTFTFAGAWSSRLSDCGFHANHIHPRRWISSCYYIGLPDAVKDEETKQGWIKFGEPDLDVGLSYRRAIQPVVGRLVLFPSYMWHGTIPFHDRSPRTAIAFDVMPA